MTEELDGNGFDLFRGWVRFGVAAGQVGKVQVLGEGGAVAGV